MLLANSLGQAMTAQEVSTELRSRGYYPLPVTLPPPVTKPAPYTPYVPPYTYPPISPGGPILVLPDDSDLPDFIREDFPPLPYVLPYVRPLPDIVDLPPISEYAWPPVSPGDEPVLELPYTYPPISPGGPIDSDLPDFIREDFPPLPYVLPYVVPLPDIIDLLPYTEPVPGIVEPLPEELEKRSPWLIFAAVGALLVLIAGDEPKAPRRSVDKPVDKPVVNRRARLRPEEGVMSTPHD